MVVPGTVPRTRQQKMQAQVEGVICAQADVAIWFTDQALASAKARHPVLGERGHSVLPGVDAPPFALAPYQPGEKFVIGHFGSLSETRNLVSTIAALDLLLDQQPALEGRVELHVYGGPLDRLTAAAASQARHSFIRHFGRIEADAITGKSGREQILQRMRSVDVLLLLHGIEPICAEYIPSKMYEYFWAGRPIVATVHANVQMETILRDQGHAVVPTQACQDVAVALLHAFARLLADWQSKGIPTRAELSAYTTEAAVTQQLRTLQTGLK
jgi:glycosyltransferase involved in cell wall biosynthesis